MLVFEDLMEKHHYKIMLLIGTVVAVFGISLGNGFVWDDTYFFIGKKVYADFQLREIFLSLANGVEYLPLRDLTYAIDHQLWGQTQSASISRTLLFTWLTFR